MFGSDLDKSTQAQLNRGQRLQEILKQLQYEPMSLEQMVTVLFAGTNGYADQIPVEKMRQWETTMLRFMETSFPALGKDIAEKKMISPETDKKLREALKTFNASFVVA
jgi:F-type H+-transporting ATPase subunit alpha